MEIASYSFFFVVVLFIFALARFVIRDLQEKAMYYVVSSIFFFVLMILSLGVTDSSGTPFAQNNFDYLVPLGFSFIMFVMSMFYFLIEIVPIWNRNFKKKDLKGF